MFVLKLKIGAELDVPGRDLTIKVLGVRPGEVSLGFASPSGARVYKQKEEFHATYDCEADSRPDPDLQVG